MRVRLNLSSVSPSTCGVTQYGQTENYTVNIDKELAIADINKANVSVCPNPFKDVLKICDVKDAKVISVTDMCGRVVASPKVSPEFNNLSNLNKGIYSLTVSYEYGSTKSFKVIKE